MMRAKGTILIVDDEKDIRELLGEMLEAEGYKIHLAKCESEALESIRNHELNLVLLDLKLTEWGDLGGMTVLNEALRMKPRLQVIIITAHGTIQAAVEATRAGAYDFIEKPLDQERLKLLVRRAIERDVLLTDMEALRRMALDTYEMIGTSPAMQNVYALIEKAAPTKAKVLITGESGVGKELVARAIHHLSPRTARPFRKVNCAAIPSDLMESELFGTEKGAYTGAVEKPGQFERADGGTIFLDEIGDMSLMHQAKVLRVLQEEEFQRVGGTQDIRVDVRFIGATRKDLKTEIDEGNFREDLFYRLNVITIPVPPLRERRDDIPQLLDHYVHVFCDENNLMLKRFSPDAKAFLKNHEWKGNIRELKNLAEKLVILTESDIIGRQHVVNAIQDAPIQRWVQERETLREARDRFECDYIRDVLESHNGNVTQAAAVLGMNRVNLYRKMKRYGLER